MKKNSEDGFTLIELLVVIVIAGVLGSIAAPGWLSFITRQRLNSVQDEMLQVFQSAQSDAQRTNKPYEVSIGTTVGNASLSTTPGTYDSLGPEQIRSKLKLETPKDASGNDITEITFNEKGQIEVGVLPFVLKASLDESSAKPHCIVFTTLLGDMATAEGDTCDNPNYAP